MTQTIRADIEMIKTILPHRYPFLLVDKVEDIDGIKSARGIKNVTINEPFFQGHFPQEPVMPGVLIVEAMAQTAAVIAGLHQNDKDQNLVVYFMGIDKCKFRRKVVPGDVLNLHIETLRGGGKTWKIKGRAIVDGALAAEAELLAMINILE